MVRSVVVVPEYAIKCFWDYKLIEDVDLSKEEILELGDLRALDVNELTETQIRYLREADQGISDDVEIFISETDALIEKMERDGERLDVVLGYARWVKW